MANRYMILDEDGHFQYYPQYRNGERAYESRYLPSLKQCREAISYEFDMGNNGQRFTVLDRDYNTVEIWFYCDECCCGENAPHLCCGWRDELVQPAPAGGGA